MSHRTALPHVLRPVRRAAVAVVASLALAAGGLLVSPPAHAAGTTIVVGSTADPAVTDCDTITALPSPVSLRSAFCVANNTAGAVTVMIPAGTYRLTQGPLVLGTAPSSNITVTGAGAAATIIDGGGVSQVLNLDPLGAGGVAVTLASVTITGGNDNQLGGGGIIGGNPNGGQVDTLAVVGSTFTNNRTTAGGALGPGGAIQFSGGSLSVQNSTFTGNSATGSFGGAILFDGTGPGRQALTVSGSTFHGNTAGPSSDSTVAGGGAIAIRHAQTATVNLIGNTFDGNSAAGATGRGGAVYNDSGTVTATGSTYTGNTAASGAALAADGASVTARFNRITGNTGGSAVAASSGQLDENWWGCNGGPGAAGCDTVTGGAGYSPRLVLATSASPSAIQAPATTSTVTASLTTDSAGGAVAPAALQAFAGAALQWQATGVGSVSPTTSTFTNGRATTTFTASGGGAATVTATFDRAAVATQLGVLAPPTFTSAATMHATLGTAASFTVTATGYPTPSIALAAGDSLPAGLALADHGDGTATISGTVTDPAAAGSHPVTLVASASGATAQQAFTVIVDAAPAITSPDSATFTAGSAANFGIVATGSPTPTVTVTGALPSGVSLDQTGGATRLGGTPAAGSGGRYPLDVTAANTVGSVSQHLTVTVNEAPSFSTADHATFTTGAAGSFSVRATGGYPAVTGVTVTGTLPAGVTATPGPGILTIAGTAAAGQGGVYPLTVTASNGVVTAQQQFTLTVNEAPVVTTAPADQRVLAATPVSFTAAAAGFPAPALQWQVSTDGGAHFTDITGATAATLSFTAKQADDGSIYRARFSNDAGTVSAQATLTVGTAAAFTSAPSATFTVGGGAQHVTVTTSGVPHARISAAGLPAWLTLADNGDGTATIAGTPPAASGGLVSFTLSAGNGFGATATQPFTLTVNEAAAFTSGDAAGFTVGAAGDFTVTTSHAYPAVTGITIGGRLPDGVTFTDRGDGSALIAGTPKPGSGGIYAVTLTTVGSGTPVTQRLTITVSEAPLVTSAATATFTRGVAGSFTITTAHAYPAPTLTVTGALPTGLTFRDNGDGTGTISDTTLDAAAGFSLDVTASNGVDPDATQRLTLTVAAADAVPLPPLPPAGDNLAGVPAQTARSQSLRVSGDGFAPFAIVTVGFYSAPRTLATVTADSSGAFTAAITIPADAVGSHTIVAAAIDPSGVPRYLAAGTLVVAPASPGGSSVGGTATSSGGTPATIASTGLPENAPSLALAGLLLLALGTLCAVRMRLRRRRS